MKKEIDGKTYVPVPELEPGSCGGCAAVWGGKLCVALSAGGGKCSSKIWKEETMENDREKTAVELVNDMIAQTCNGSPTNEAVRNIKAAIEREQASAITMRPIAELPDKVPDGCIVVGVTGEDVDRAWSISMSGEVVLKSLWCGMGLTHFYILPLPAVERKLHKCYMPGCGGDAAVVETTGLDASKKWYIKCSICNSTGPLKPTKHEAMEAWGWEEVKQ